MVTKSMRLAQRQLSSLNRVSQSNDVTKSIFIGFNDDSFPQSRLVKTAIPGPKSLAFMARKNAAVSGGVGVSYPMFMEKAHGAIVQDVDGNRFIDMGAGIGVMNVGHCNDRVVSAIQEQAQTMTHTCFTATPYLSYIQVAEALNLLTPGTHEKKSVLLNSGAEAVENAVKIARSFTKRTAVVVFEHGYHGRTNLTMAMTAKNIPYKQGFGPFASDIYRVPMAYPYRWPGGPEACARDALDAIKLKIEKEIGFSNVACVVIEPIQGEGGFVVPPKGFLKGLQEFATKEGIVFVADEVQTGFGRTGHMFACEQEGVIPDLIISAKGIAGGMPLSAVTGRAHMMDAVHAGGMGGTYSGNPLSCAAALAVFESFEKDKILENARMIGDILSRRLAEMQIKYPIIGDVRGRGGMQAIELVLPGTKQPNTSAVSGIVKYCYENGVLILTAGTYGNVIRFLPPLVMKRETLEDALNVLDSAIQSVSNK